MASKHQKTIEQVFRACAPIIRRGGDQADRLRVCLVDLVIALDPPSYDRALAIRDGRVVHFEQARERILNHRRRRGRKQL